MTRFSTRQYRKQAPTLAPESGRGATIPPARGADPALAAMNGVEARYSGFLTAETAAGRVAAWWYQKLTWRLGTGVHYRPDFVVLRPDGLLEIHEVKARAKAGDFGATEASWAKVKATAGEAPFRVCVVWPGAQGQWHMRVVSPVDANVEGPVDAP